MNATIWHNNRCSNSRGALALLQEAGADIEVIDYLATPPDPATLRQLLDEMGMPARDLLRSKEAAYVELGLADKLDDEAALVGAMAMHPALINRPIVRTPKGTALCRPPETVRTLL
ncbi:MAG: arsenate reductase (glutaredoxin) [Stenotrophomonas nitritireducens]|uniref:arsenate reductase (glutaredoxin) n=1 Tax=Stenotrophomonas nitritireducens TaxID=83617 RepID=UPI001AD040AE|nr:arsenate reductase (glutaredoxin) [Stenotrophomonas nitritireducens]MBN8769057.1 arsenate reductase (glutaredoxin) [Stenotrophomonas sp.]MBN8793095.1 arsenate reductase (glutaredoxin) [Stenotrophomonas nitritireducens]